MTKIDYNKFLEKVVDGLKTLKFTNSVTNYALFFDGQRLNINGRVSWKTKSSAKTALKSYFKWRLFYSDLRTHRLTDDNLENFFKQLFKAEVVKIVEVTG